MSRWQRVLAEEIGGFSFRRFFLCLLENFLPAGVGGRLRARLYGVCGCAIGPGVIIAGPLTFGIGSRLQNFHVGSGCFLNSPLFVDAAACVTLGEGVSVGHHVVIITSDHAVGPPQFRAGAVHPASVIIEKGAWIAAGVTLLPGVTVGAGAVVAAGAVVTKNIPPHTLAGGIPAKVIRCLDQ